MTVRPMEADDLKAVREILVETALFPAPLLADMAQRYLAGEAGDLWYVSEGASRIDGFCYAAPEEMADGTWNMLAIAVHPISQASGVGRRLVAALERELRARGQRLLIVDTSGMEAFEQARMFYRGIGYVEEARIRDFWAPGDDKVVFRKAL